MKSIVSTTLVHPSKFYLRNKMLGASVDILDQLLELSVTGDTAKYLVFNSAEVVHFHH
jgi:hypothetical protein